MKKKEESTNGKGTPLTATLVRLAAAAMFMFGMILMCLADDDDEPIRWAPFIATKVGGAVALVASSVTFTWSERKWGPADPDDKDDNC